MANIDRQRAVYRAKQAFTLHHQRGTRDPHLRLVGNEWVYADRMYVVRMRGNGALIEAYPADQTPEQRAKVLARREAQRVARMWARGFTC
jgi:hypothetical protein